MQGAVTERQTTGISPSESGRSIVIDYFDDGRKRNLNNFAIGPFNFDGRRREGESCLHAADNTTHTMTVAGDDFDIPLAV